MFSNRSKTSNSNYPLDIETTITKKFDKCWQLFIQDKRKEALDTLKSFKKTFQAFEGDKVKDSLEKINFGKRYLILFNKLFPVSVRLKANPAELFLYNKSLVEEIWRKRSIDNLDFILNEPIKSFFLRKLKNTDKQKQIKNILASAFEFGIGEEMEEITGGIFKSLNLSLKISSAILGSYGSKSILVSPNLKTQASLSSKPSLSEEKEEMSTSQISTISEDKTALGLSLELADISSLSNPLIGESKAEHSPSGLEGEDDFPALLRDINNFTLYENMGGPEYNAELSPEPIFSHTAIKESYADAWILFKKGKKEDAISVLEGFFLINKQNLNEEMTIQIKRAIDCFHFLNEHFSYDSEIHQSTSAIEPQPKNEMPNPAPCSSIQKKSSILSVQAPEFMPSFSTNGDEISPRAISSVGPFNARIHFSSVPQLPPSDALAPSHFTLFPVSPRLDDLPLPNEHYLFPTSKIPSSKRKHLSRLEDNSPHRPPSVATNVNAFWPKTPKFKLNVPLVVKPSLNPFQAKTTFSF